MATIITVHGTFSSGSENGNQWWQRGSEFERDVREFVESEDGRPVDFKPFTWDGLNSETSRRKAADKLLSFIKPLDNKEHYVLIGHSHGGSVIALALLSSVALRSIVRRHPARTLSKFITVGTPFLVMRTTGTVFSRLPILEKTLLLSAILFTSILVVASYTGNSTANFNLGYIANLIGALTGVLYSYLRHVDRLRHAAASHRWLKSAMTNFGDKHLCLRHANDEAIRALNGLKSLSADIFALRIFIPSISVFGMLLAPAIVFGGLELFYRTHSDALNDNMNASRNWHIGGPHYLLERIMHIISANGISNDSRDIVPLAFLASMMLVACASAVIILVSILIGYLAGFIVIPGLNRSAWRHLHGIAYGTDVYGEKCEGTRTEPSFVDNPSGTLPIHIESALVHYADAAASKSIGKLRTAIGEVGASVGIAPNGDWFSSYLTWDELIHTAYFKVEVFRKLVCFAIANSRGFRPSERLKADPDYDKLRQWLAELQSAYRHAELPPPRHEQDAPANGQHQSAIS